MIDDCWCSLSKSYIQEKPHWREKPQTQHIHTVKCNTSVQCHLLLADADSTVVDTGLPLLYITSWVGAALLLGDYNQEKVLVGALSVIVVN